MIGLDITRITPIKDALPDHVTYEQIRIVLAILERQYGMDGQAADEKKTVSNRPKKKNGMHNFVWSNALQSNLVMKL